MLRSRLSLSVRSVGQIDLLLLVDVKHRDIRSQPRPCRRLVVRIKLAEPVARNGSLRCVDHLARLFLRLFLGLSLRLFADLGKISRDRRKGFLVRRTGHRKAALFLIGLDRVDRALAQLAAAVPVVKSQFPEILLQRDHRASLGSHGQFRAHKPLFKDAVAADGRIVEAVNIAPDLRRFRAEDMVVAFDGMHPVNAVAVLRDKFDDAHMLGAVFIFAAEEDQVAGDGHVCVLVIHIRAAVQ